MKDQSVRIDVQAAACGAGAGGAFPCWAADAPSVTVRMPAAPQAPTGKAAAPPPSDRFVDPWR